MVLYADYEFMYMKAFYKLRALKVSYYQFRVDVEEASPV